jgi:hypothetical protein
MAVRVTKPCHKRAAGRMPYFVQILIHSLITLEDNSYSTQIFHRPANVGNRPTHRRVRSDMNTLNLLNPQHGIADAKHQCRRLVRHKLQAKNPLIERPRALSIRGCQKQDWIIEAHEPLYFHRQTYFTSSR